MSKRCLDDTTGAAAGAITWQQADVRQMEEIIPSESVDVAFDKGTLDAMIYGSPWDPPSEVRTNTGRYLREVCTFFPLFLSSFGAGVKSDYSHQGKFDLSWISCLRLAYFTGLSCPQTGWYVLIRDVPATSFYKTSIELGRS